MAQQKDRTAEREKICDAADQNEEDGVNAHLPLFHGQSPEKQGDGG